MMDRTGIGARPLEDGRCAFRVWAPRAERLEVLLFHETARLVEMTRQSHGYYEAVVDGASPGARYMYRLNGSKNRPDPASRYQPQGVHGPSQVVDTRFEWIDAAWTGISLDRAVFYEAHVGTFTPPGTFDAMIDHLDRLRDLGITCLELMPVAQFPGERNWGYDGAAPFAVQNSYGGPPGLRRLVNACHARGLGVALDVVYNHLGPEGNYLEDFGRYFTEKYRTPWGKALNFDDADCDEVRSFFIDNALMWIEEYHIDALRLDAVHAIFDQSAYPFLHELSDRVHERAQQLGRRAVVVAESDLNDPKVVRHPSLGGWGLDAAWSDDFHHSLHALLTGENTGYYRDFGSLRHLAAALRSGYVYSGDYSDHRRRRHGAPALDIPPKRHVVCAQNHDQVGNRMKGDRLTSLLTFEQLKVAAALVLLSAFTPLLFMGEEYGETAPFQYFVSHGDAALIEAVRKGRASEFASFEWTGEVDDPQAEETFLSSQLNHALRETTDGRRMERFYRELITLRTRVPAICWQDRLAQDVAYDESRRLLVVRRAVRRGGSAIVLAVNLSDTVQHVTMPDDAPRWSKAIDTADARWGGPDNSAPDAAAPFESIRIAGPSAVLYTSEESRG